MSEVVEFQSRRWSRGYCFAYADNPWVTHGGKQVQVEVPLESMFKTRPRTEALKVFVEGGPECLRALSPLPRRGAPPEYVVVPDRPALYNENPKIQVLPKDLYQDFMSLPSRRSRDGGESEVLKFVNRHGLLHDHEHPLERYPETVAYWHSKAEEMHKATKLRDLDQLEPKHYRRIDAHMGLLHPVSSKNARPGGMQLAYQAETLLAALWLQWSRGSRDIAPHQGTIPYQGECAVCGGPLIGRRSMRTCSPYCRKIMSLEKQK